MEQAYLTYKNLLSLNNTIQSLDPILQAKICHLPANEGTTNNTDIFKSTKSKIKRE